MRACSVRRPFVRVLAPLVLVGVVVGLLVGPFSGDVRRADAAVVGTGRLTAVDFDGSPPSFTFDGTFRWDDTPFTVLGTPVNLGATLPGDQAVANGVVTALNLGDLSADFVVSLLSSSSGSAFLDLTDIAGSAVCTAPSCVNATATFLGIVGDVDASAGLLPSAPLVYTIDGSITLNVLLQGSGPFGLNAFAPQATPAGDDVTVGSGDDTFYDSLQQEILGFAATASFPVVHEPGQTLFQALSTAEGTIPPNIVLDPPGLESIFIDITTTAVYGGAVLVCVVVPDTVTIPLDELRLLHRTGAGPASPEGAFVDVTETFETSPNRICGFVNTLSPFVVGAIVTEPTSTTTTTATVPTSTTTSITTTTSTTASTVVTTTTTSTTVVTTTTTSTTVTTTTTTSSTSTTTSTSSTTLPPVCLVAPTFDSILCRLDEAIALVEESALTDPTRRNLLRSLRAARDKTLAAEERVDGGRSRGAKGKLKSAARSVNGALFRLRSLNGSRRIPEDLAAALGDLLPPIQDDMQTLRGTL